jgi:hypothetical protein
LRMGEKLYIIYSIEKMLTNCEWGIYIIDTPHQKRMWGSILPSWYVQDETLYCTTPQKNKEPTPLDIDSLLSYHCEQ